MERYIRKPDILEMIHVHGNTLDNWVKQGKFPQPIKFGGRVKFWEENTVRRWIQEKFPQACGTATEA